MSLRYARVLGALDDGLEVCPEIASAIGQSHEAVYQTLRELIALGAVVREPSPTFKSHGNGHLAYRHRVRQASEPAQIPTPRFPRAPVGHGKRAIAALARGPLGLGEIRAVLGIIHQGTQEVLYGLMKDGLVVREGRRMHYRYRLAEATQHA